MELLGINPVLLLAQIISFGFLFIVLKKFLYGNIAKTLESRRESIRDIEKKNTEVEKKIIELTAERVELEKKNRIEINKIISESQKTAEGLKSDIIEQAENKSKKIIADAIIQIEQERIKASDGLKKEAAKLAAQMASKILSEPSNAQKTTDISIAEFKKIAMKKIKNG